MPSLTTKHLPEQGNTDRYCFCASMAIAQQLTLSPSELHCTFHNDLFVLKTAVTINGQPAEIKFSGSDEVTLSCRRHKLQLSFSEVSFKLGAVLKKYSVCRVNGDWFDAAPYIHVRIEST